MLVVTNLIALIILLATLIASADACKATCAQPSRTRTNIFIDHWRKNPRDFWINVPYSDPCEAITNEALRKEFPILFTEWSIGHIIEKSNDYPEFAYCPRNIRANLVAVNTTWNNQISDLCCDYTNVEKDIVYGDRYHEALNAVVSECCLAGLKGKIRVVFLYFLYVVLMLVILFAVVTLMACLAGWYLNNRAK